MIDFYFPKIWKFHIHNSWTKKCIYMFLIWKIYLHFFIYITTCNNEAYTLLPLCRDPVKCRDYSCKTLRIDAPNNPVVAKLQILRPSAQPQTPTTKCSNVSPFRIWIELTDLALARYASHASHWFVASDAHPALHTQCCIPDPHHLERFQTMLCFCNNIDVTSHSQWGW